jgi:ergothioneine biosynthesis protein EgtB
MPVAATERAAALEWYRRNRERSRRLFDLIEPSAYYTRPISLRNPIVFYEGHLPAFSAIAFLERGLGRPPVDAALERLFARGIDPHSQDEAVPRSGASTQWPRREAVLAFARACDEAVIAAIEREPLAVEGLYTALEHEAMHQETLLYMWRRVPYAHKRGQTPASEVAGAAAPRGQTPIPAGTATLGARRDEIVFGWDNEFEAHRVHVPAFEIDVHNVTNAEYLEFIAAGGYDRREWWDDAGWRWVREEHVRHPAFWTRREPRVAENDPRSEAQSWFWRGMFEQFPLPLSWPVYVSHAEASAYARWQRRRLMTEAEFHRAAYGTPSGEERAQPWGDAPPDAVHGNFDFQSWEPAPVGSFPAGASAWGVHDLVGNGWEWTSTVFAPFPGFQPMRSYPEYSAEFFDGEHYVMKGASCGTARELVRRSFRNWFRPNYPYVYATFRTVKDLE